MESIPMFLPVAHNVQNCELIAKYPVDEWIDRGGFPAKKRCRLAMEIASNDLENLWEALAEKEDWRLPEDFPEDKIVPDGAEVFASMGSASSSGPSGQHGRGASSRAKEEQQAPRVMAESAGISAAGQRTANALEGAQLAAVLTASSREAGGAPDEVCEC